MKEFIAKTGGIREYSFEDLCKAQNEILKAVQDQYKDLGDFIFSGCVISGSSGAYTISAGLVYLGGRLRVFDQVNGIESFPKYIVPSVVAEDSRVFKLGETKTVVDNHKAVLSDDDGGGAAILVNSGAANRYFDVIQDSGHRLVTDQQISEWEYGSNQSVSIVGSGIESGVISFINKYNVVNFSMVLSISAAWIASYNPGDVIGSIQSGFPQRSGRNTSIKLTSSINGSFAVIDIAFSLFTGQLMLLKKEVFSYPNSGFNHYFQTTGSYIL